MASRINEDGGRSGGAIAPVIDWRVSTNRIPYPDAVAQMEARATAIRTEGAAELIWLLEHPSIYTGGTSAHAGELLDPRFPVVASGRGGRYTYHGPGQRIGYLVLDLAARGRDVRRFVHALEQWLIDTLRLVGIEAFRVPDRIGIWTTLPDRRVAKIGAIGVQVRRWVTLHGFAINLSPDLSHFTGIVPCGIADAAVTSAAALGQVVEPDRFDAALRAMLPRFLQTLSSQPKNSA